MYMRKVKEKNKNSSPQIPNPSDLKSKRGEHLTSKCHRVYIRTFGCQMNEHDTERVKDLFLRGGYSIAKKPEAADILLFNTCSPL